MPGVTSAKLLEEGGDFVVIETNEGIMKRTHISINRGAAETIIEFDEEYAAGKAVTATTQFSEKFEKTSDGLTYHLSISNIHAPGFMGFLYRSFGSKNIGNAFLKSYTQLLEK